MVETRPERTTRDLEMLEQWFEDLLQPSPTVVDCRKAFGTTLSRYLLGNRIYYAQQLLLSTDAKIPTVNGTTDPAYPALLT